MGVNSKKRGSGYIVRNFIIKHVTGHPSDIAAFTAKEFNITRQAVNKHLQLLVKEGYLHVTGKKTSKVYTLRTFGERSKVYELSEKLEEHVLWNNFKDLFADMPKHVEDISFYGFTEMINNAIDHSMGSRLAVVVQRNPKDAVVIISDNGEGIFKKITREYNLPDERLALLELAKGKLTTDPQHHTGEGIFFTSRAFDTYVIISGDLAFSHDTTAPPELQDWLHKGQLRTYEGTIVFMRISYNHKETLKEIFDRFASENTDYAFTKTVIPVRLAQFEQEGLLSRSQAKRLVARFEKFSHIILDFAEVNQIGQAFADEIFRVFAKEHPQIKLKYINTTKDVAAFIKRAQKQG